MNRQEMIDKAIQNQLNSIQQDIQEAMDRGWNKVQSQRIRTENLYKSVRDWLVLNEFEIKTVQSSSTSEDGKLYLTWQKDGK